MIGRTQIVEDIVLLIGRSLISERRSQDFSSLRDDCALRFLGIQVRNLPDFFLFSFLLLGALFRIHARVRYGRSVFLLSRAQCSNLVLRWKHSPITLLRDFVRFIDAMVIYGQHDSLEK
jgi:hypothetical protein